ncbi:beta-lactamase family protein [Fulvivirga ulvae]|uniref:serine hydrolase domain-containing protein n=1 Tax=Fulvivirga ulvae TaxID=2904245 RepID=UPI001F2A311B|nr:serine hydrolase [Fulvivirga ulvae]UII30863.1 beta-lactamase family protein [Fulvivirga ulvae]
MKKLLTRFFLLVILIILIYGLSYAWRAFPIISGYGAKNLCSCTYVSGRTPESVIKNELGAFPLSLGTFRIDQSDSSAHGEVFGLAAKKAIYRKGLGCTLISEINESEMRSLEYKLPDSIITLSDTVDWPLGTTIPDSVNSAINMKALKKAVGKAFQEPDKEHPQNTRAVVVIHDGKLILEQYADGYDSTTPQMGWSMTKSVTNALISLLIKDGKLHLYQPAPIELWKAEGDARGIITIDHLLRMSSGLEWEEEYSGPSSATNMLFKQADMGVFAAGFPLENPPDTKWYYSSGTSNILSLIVRQNVNSDYYSFAYERLFNKLGMTSAVIEPDASGVYVGSSYMYATPRDWAKFGLLYLNDGVWNGERILPEGWVKYSSTPTPGAKRGEYGAHFWLNAGAVGDPSDRWYPDAPTDIFSMNGFEGQRVFIVPSKKAVIVRLGLTKRGDFDFNEFLKEVLNTLPD